MFSFDYFVTGKEISHRDLPPVFSFAVQLRSVTGIAPKSLLLCVKRIPIRCDFRAGAKAKRTVSLGNHVLGKPQGHQSVWWTVLDPQAVWVNDATVDFSFG